MYSSLSEKKIEKYDTEWKIKIGVGSIVIILWIVFLILNVAFIASFVTTIFIILLLVKPRLVWLQITTLIILFCFAWIYNIHGSLVSREYWPLRLYKSWGGQSSCTQVPNVPLPYNPNGLKYDDLEDLNVPYAFCTYSDMRWADDVWVPSLPESFKGTSEELLFSEKYVECNQDCTLASTWKQDYQNNFGRGLTLGWAINVSPSNTIKCPKTTIKNTGQRAKGDLIPSYCLWSFVHSGKFSNEVIDYYPIEYINPLCTFCPGYWTLESEHVGGIRAFFVWTSLLFVFVLGWSITSCVLKI